MRRHSHQPLRVRAGDSKHPEDWGEWRHQLSASSGFFFLLFWIGENGMLTLSRATAASQSPCSSHNVSELEAEHPTKARRLLEKHLRGGLRVRI